jgi:hypothetical protein
METNSGQKSHLAGFDSHPYACEFGYSTEELGQNVLAALQQTPDSVWKNQSRPNVRPSGQTSSLQISLGLVTSASWRRLPLPSSHTWHFLNLTKLINLYVRRLARDQVMQVPLQGTTIQLTKNLASKLHRDRSNRGASFITGVGSYTQGETFLEDSQGRDEMLLSEDIPRIGSAGTLIQGRKEAIQGKLVPFDGTRTHGTCDFSGEQYAIILYCLGTSRYAGLPRDPSPGAALPQRARLYIP